MNYRVSPGEIVEVRVRLPYAPILANATLVDTPGLASPHEENSDRTGEFLFSGDSRLAISHADALVYLVRLGSQDDVEAIEAFWDLTTDGGGGSRICMLNAVAVLTKAELYTHDERDRITARLKGDAAFRNRVADIIPVAGRLALVVRTKALREADAAALRRLASYDLESLLAATEMFLDRDACDVPLEFRTRLVELLDISGLRLAIDAAKRGSGTLNEINNTLEAESGINDLMRVIDGVFTRCADQIKASQALAGLTRLSYQTDADIGRRARVMIETLREEPEMHAINEMWALQQCARVDVEIPGWLVTDLGRMASGAGLAERLGASDGEPRDGLLDAARAGAARAHAYSMSPGADRLHASLANVLRISYTNVYRNLMQNV